MMYKKRIRLFGPPNFNSIPVQNGEGLGSLISKFSNFARKMVPIASKGLKRVANSKVVKEIGNTLLSQGVSAATDIGSVHLIQNLELMFMTKHQLLLKSTINVLSKLNCS